MAEQILPKREVVEKRLTDLNQQSSQEQKPPVPKLKLSAPVVMKKKSIGERFTNAFLGKNIKDVGGYILTSVLIPSIKTAICDIARDFPALLLFGSTNPRPGMPGYYSGYPSYWSQPNPYQYQQGTYFRYDKIGQPGPHGSSLYSGRPMSNYLTEDIILTTFKDAESLRAYMLDYINRFGEVTLQAINEALDVPNKSFTDNDWGWKNIGPCEIRAVRGGYMLVLPPIQYLK